MTVLCPGFTAPSSRPTRVSSRATCPSFLWQTPDEVASAALDAYDRGRPSVVPGALNKVAATFSEMMPSGVTRRVAKLVMRRGEY